MGDNPYMRDDYDWQHPNEFKRWLFMADKLEREPALLEIPLGNIERWLAAGRHANVGPLLWWRDVIRRAGESGQAMAELLAFLRDDGEEARRMKSCSPFPGVLTREERDRFRCAWTH